MFGRNKSSTNASKTDDKNDAYPICYMRGFLEECGPGARLSRSTVRCCKSFNEATDEFYHDTGGNYTTFERRDGSYIILVSHDCREALYAWDSRILKNEESAPSCSLSGSNLEAVKRRANSVTI